MCGQDDLRAARDIVPQDIAHAVEEIAQQRLAALLLVRRPGCRCRPDPGHGHDQHDEGRGLAAAAPAGGDEEGRPVRQQRALDHGQRSGDQGAFAGVIGRDVAQPVVGQELALPPARPPRVQSSRRGSTARSSFWISKTMPRSRSSPSGASNDAVGQDDGQRGDGDHRRQHAVVAAACSGARTASADAPSGHPRRHSRYAARSPRRPPSRSCGASAHCSGAGSMVCAAWLAFALAKACMFGSGSLRRASRRRRCRASAARVQSKRRARR